MSRLRDGRSGVWCSWCSGHEHRAEQDSKYMEVVRAWWDAGRTGHDVMRARIGHKAFEIL